MQKLTSLCFVLMLLFTFPLSAQQAYEFGDVVSDFELKNVDGSMVSMANYPDAKFYVLDFTCLTCPYAKMYEDRTIELAERVKEKGGVLIAINPNDPNRQPGDAFDLMVAHAEKANYSFPFVQDETQEVAHAFQATKTPHIMILEPSAEGPILRYRGAIDDNPRSASDVQVNYIDKVVDAIVDGEELPYQETKAIGCTIKWKES